MHGYEIRKRLRDELGQLSNVSFGSLYPALSRLERSGAVRATEDHGRSAAAPVPMTGSLSGERAALRARRSGTGLGRRSRKVYEITDEGRRQFAELLHSDQAGGNDDARNFSLRLAFARYLPPHAAPAAPRAAAGPAVPTPGRGPRRGSGGRGKARYLPRSLMEHTTESTERDIAWLDRLIEAERTRDGATAGPALVGKKATDTVLGEGDTT